MIPTIKTKFQYFNYSSEIEINQLAVLTMGLHPNVLNQLLDHRIPTSLQSNLYESFKFQSFLFIKGIHNKEHMRYSPTYKNREYFRIFSFF